MRVDKNEGKRGKEGRKAMKKSHAVIYWDHLKTIFIKCMMCNMMFFRRRIVTTARFSNNVNLHVFFSRFL